MTLQHLELLAILETDDVIVSHRFADRNGRRELHARDLFAGSELGQLAKHRLDQFGDIVMPYRVVGDMGGHDLRRQGQHLATINAMLFVHCASS